ncbi:hypothetical protein ABGB07_28285 [Micromonosporaceae bacterium B7E4]
MVAAGLLDGGTGAYADEDLRIEQYGVDLVEVDVLFTRSRSCPRPADEPGLGHLRVRR